MLKEQARVGMKVYFGRNHGEKTLGKITKINPTKAVVETLEQRGRGRGSHAGAQWHVPYTMMTVAEDSEPDQSKGTLVDLRQPEPLNYNQFQDHVEKLIIEAIWDTYIQLSPENLSADGELPMSVMRQRAAIYNRRLKGLFQALGREVSEEQAYHWIEQKRASEKKAS